MEAVDESATSVEDSELAIPVGPNSRRKHHRDITTDLDYRCGEKYGRCPSGTCCSSADCRIDFGNCDAHKTPKGPPTREIMRPHNGAVPYGPQQIRSCAVPGTVALTFDDGPTRYTGDLLDLLDKYEAPATFFITGINNGKGAIDDPSLPWASLIERMLLSGHQIASHTWSHEDLSKVSPSQRIDQMLKNEVALRNIMGSFPTYMRPPYSSCEPGSGCREDLGRMGYHITLYDVDTDDYKNDSPNLIQRSKDIFDQALSSANPISHSWLIIAHDAHEQTVHNLTEHMLQTMARLGYRPVTVGECLRDPRENWYRKDTSWHGHKKKGPKQSFPPQVSIDGTCGKNFTCLGSSFGLCCGSLNVCGNTSNHCGSGCQKNYGYCAVGAPLNGDAWDPNLTSKSGRSEADSDFAAAGTAAVTSLLLALAVALLM
ncbi:Glycoside hydrolase/deacetylase beta/alpha-barrel [Penicillium angulare]|uniref:Glycoside hydrolase/deacetylase beta/alpha-barrel n=1 Tax=Penicillium angulare TaxID=116970 RepID=UPI002540C99C|nr:Glycoside hydrolase/deacetylase beta/alpha-barrel [Penicillium angulare]KAJ5256918.1 Glycoside hydrolase/deacetylase beta/alpha-barrel [Penicillium angulare]